MSVAASLAFSQPGGGGVGAPGFAMIGPSGLAVTVSNGNNTGVLKWTFTLIDAPPTSALFGSIGVVQTGPTPTWTFTPDVPGTYQVQVTVTDNVTTASDIRVFSVKEQSGQIMPSYSEIAGYNNWPLQAGGNNARGWATNVENWLRTLDTPLVTTASSIAMNPGNAFVEFNGSTGLTATLPAAAQVSATGPFGKVIRRFYFFKNKTNQTNTIQRSGSDTIEGGTSLNLTGTGAYAMLATDGISNWDIFGGSADITLGGDVTGLATANTVGAWKNVALGSSMATPSNLMVPQYNSGLTSWQAVAASSIVSGSVTPGTSGQVYVTNATPAAVWTSAISYDSASGRFNAGAVSTNATVTIGPWTGGLSDGALWALPNGTAIGNNNYAFLSDGNSTWLNAPNGSSTGLLNFYIGNSAQLGQWTSTTLILVTPTIQWGSAVASPTISQAAPGATSAGQNMTIAPQAGGATSGIPGSLLLNIAAPNGGSTEGFVVVERATTPMVRLGPYTGAPTSFGAIYFLDAGSPSSTNWAFLGSASDTYFNAPVNNMYFKIANNTIAMGATSQHVDFGGATSASVTPALTIDFSGGTTAPVIKTGNTTATTALKMGITAMTADVATGNLTIQGAYPFSTATLTHRTPGNVIFDIGAPTNSGTTEALIQYSRNATVIGAVGIAQNSLPTYGAMWLGTTNVGGSTNWAIRSDGVGSTYVNAESLGAVGFLTAGANFQLYISGSIAYWGGSTTSAPVQINWVTATTPLIQSGTSATSFTLSTLNTTTTTTLKVGITAMTADVTPGNLTIQGAYAWSSATTHQTAGNVIFDVGPPVGASTVEAKFQFTRNGAVISQIAAADSVPTNGRYWLGSTAFTASNWAFQSDAANATYFNTPTSALLAFVSGGGAAAFGAFQLSTFYIGASSAPAPIQINWTTVTTPLIQSGTSATSLTAGTNKAAAAFILQGDAAVTVETISGAGVAWSVSASQSANFNFSTSTGKVYWSVNTSGGAVTGTLPAASSVTAGTTWYAQDNQGSFQANAFTLAPNGTDKINGRNASVPFNTNWATILIWTDGTQWFARGI